MLKELQIECWVPTVAVAVKPKTTAGDFFDFCLLIASMVFVTPSFSLIISLILR